MFHRFTFTANDYVLSVAFTELQAKVIDTQQKVKLADIQIDQLNRTKKHAHLTDTEIMTLADETRMYEGVGRILGFGKNSVYAETEASKRQEWQGPPESSEHKPLVRMTDSRGWTLGTAGPKKQAATLPPPPLAGCGLILRGANSIPVKAAHNDCGLSDEHGVPVTALWGSF
ncbi:UNVERIFIED_CONTAM: hypothetical protein K2H54_015758 [Gekko kuhli]